MAILSAPDLAAAEIVNCMRILISSLSDAAVDHVDPHALLQLDELAKYVSCEEFLVEFLAADGAKTLIELVSNLVIPSKKCEAAVWSPLLITLAKLASPEVEKPSTESSSTPSFCWSEVPDDFILSVMNCPFLNCDWQCMRLGLTVLKCILTHLPEKISVIAKNRGAEFVYRLLKRLCLRLVDIPHTTSTVAPPPSASATLRSFVVRSKSVNSVRDSSSTINCILADRGERLELENLLVMLLRRMIGCIERTDTAALRDLIRADGMLAIVEDLAYPSQCSDAPTDASTWSSGARGLKRSSRLPSPIASPLLRATSTRETEILRELLILQDFILLPVRELLSRPLNADDSLPLVFLEDLHELVYGSMAMLISDTQKTDIYERFGFSDPAAPLADFQGPMGSFYFCCLCTLIDHAPEFIVSLLGEFPNVPRTDRSHFQCLSPNNCLRLPVVAAAKMVIHILCHLFGLLPEDSDAFSFRPQYLPPQQQQTDFEHLGRWLYFPFLSSVDHIESAFTDLFLISFRTFCDTWSVLNAAPSDMCRVSQITAERLTTALSSFPTQPDALAAGLVLCDVGSVRRLWSDWMADAERSLVASHPAIAELRAQLVDYYRATVRTQRLHCMVSGPPLHYLETKGVLKDRGALKVSLSPDHKSLLLRDASGQDVGHWPLSLLVSVSCSADEKRAKSWRRNIVLFLKQADLLEKEESSAYKTSTLKPTRVMLTAPTELLYNYWLDGLNILQKCLPASDRFNADVNQLVDIDLQMRLLGLDLTLIPERPVSPPTSYPDVSSLPV
uniref:ELMO domain-containing protein n=1 Tax=Schistocephalus solidus TaxID=70667 RepID=A0A0X3P398_SCHSO